MTMHPIFREILNGAETLRSWIGFVVTLLLWSFLPIGSGFVHSAPLDSHRDQFARAERALNKGNHAEYERLLKALDHYPLLPYLRYLQVRKSLNAHAVRQYLEQYDGLYYAARLRKIYLMQLAAQGQWKTFVEMYRNYDSVILECHYYRALYENGLKNKALEGARALWLSGDSRPDECDQTFVYLRKSSVFTPDLAWQRFALALEKGQNGLAKYLMRFLDRGDRAAAKDALKVANKPEILSSCPAFRAAARDGWIFAQGVERLSRKQLLKAISLWDARSPDHPIESELKDRVKRNLAVKVAVERYPFAYARFLDLNPEYSDQDSRYWRIRAALMGQSWDRVRESIEALDPDEKKEVRWKYWLARALENLNQQEEAERLYHEAAKERDYYGFLAADRIGTEYQIASTPAELASDDIAKFESSPQMQIIREWLSLDRDIEARRNWWFILGKLDRREKILAAKIAEKWGLQKEAVLTAAKAEYWDDLPLRFPLMYRQAIVESAKINQLPVNLVFGLVRQESIFDHSAVSPAGALGLMQIMPATGRSIAREIHESRPSQSKLLDPRTNVRYGTHYFKGLVDQFNKNFALAAAGYNAGPHRVQRWLPVGKSLDSDIWVEIIPFRETRRYVRYVLGYAVIYQQRLNSGGHRLREFMPVVAARNSVKNVEFALRDGLRCH